MSIVGAKSADVHTFGLPLLLDFCDRAFAHRFERGVAIGRMHVAGARVAQVALQRQGTRDAGGPSDADGLVGDLVGDFDGVLLGGGEPG